MFNLFFATLYHLKDTRMILIIPLTIYSGLEQGFIFADFTKVTAVYISLKITLLPNTCSGN